MQSNLITNFADRKATKKQSTMTTEEMRIYNDAWVTMNPTTSRGHYKIQAEVYGISASVTTTDSELYDLWSDEDTRDQAREQAFELALDEIKQKAADIYMGAVYTTNADPALCEDEDTAMMLAELLSINDEEITPDDEDDNWDTMLAKLDLTEDNNVKAIHRCDCMFQETLICLSDDYDY